MNIIFIPLLGVLRAFLELYSWAVIVYTILSWLIAFNIVNSFNRIVFSVVNFLANLVDPILIRFRKVIPPFSGIDLSPLLLIGILSFLKGMITMMMEALY